MDEPWFCLFRIHQRPRSSVFYDFSDNFYKGYNNTAIYAKLAEEWKKNNSTSNVNMY